MFHASGHWVHFMRGNFNLIFQMETSLTAYGNKFQSVFRNAMTCIISKILPVKKRWTLKLNWGQWSLITSPWPLDGLDVSWVMSRFNWLSLRIPQMWEIFKHFSQLGSSNSLHALILIMYRINLLFLDLESPSVLWHVFQRWDVHHYSRVILSVVEHLCQLFLHSM